ncbi:MAG TPA: ferredoxin [Solirubrobacteraceae bacterium]|nr:ferredoxin [Solirubrobacteraceae bacterium]
MAYEVQIDEGSCIAQGDCVETAPEAFALDDHARVIGTAPDELLLEAARACPVEAIAIVDSDSGERLYP